MQTLDVKSTQLPEPSCDEQKNIWPSAVGTILGLNPYQTPLELWMIQTGREAQPNLNEIEAVGWGVRLEPVIAQAYSEREGVKLRRINRTIVHPAHLWWRGKIDYQVLNQDERTLLEIKNASEYMRGKWGADGSDSVPDYYAVQIRAYMPLDLGFDRATLAALIGGNTLRSYYLERDDELEQLITSRLIEWRELLIADRVPAPMTVADLEILWPNNSEDVIEATDDILSDISRLVQINGSLKELESAKEEIASRIKMFAGERGAIADPIEHKVLATYRTIKQSRIDTTALKTAEPKIAERFMVETSFRSLRIK